MVGSGVEGSGTSGFWVGSGVDGSATFVTEVGTGVACRESVGRVIARQ